MPNDNRPDTPDAGSEIDTLVGFLEFHRATLEWKCADLDDAGLRATLGPSTMTLGGLLKHLAYVEDVWISARVFDRPRIAPWNAVDWDADPDWDWHSAADDTGEQLRALWSAAVARSRVVLAEALEQGGLDQLAKGPRRDGSIASLRWIVVHLIEEYSRHNGHADLLREAVDGRTGE